MPMEALVLGQCVQKEEVIVDNVDSTLHRKRVNDCGRKPDIPNLNLVTVVALTYNPSDLGS